MFGKHGAGQLKKLCIEATEQDTLYGKVFDGMDGMVLKTKEAEAMMKREFPVLEAFKGSSCPTTTNSAAPRILRLRYS